MSAGRHDALRILEAILFASTEPMTEAALAGHLESDADIASLVEDLARHYANRGVNLVRRDGKWAFRTAEDLAGRLQIEVPVIRKLSRAGVETLAIIAYHQPVTRAEIEEIRGVELSRGTLDTLLELGWIQPKGRRRTPGRPVTWVATTAFYDHFGLEGRESLPGIEELRAAGLLEVGTGLSPLAAQAAGATASGEEEAPREEPLDEEALVGDLPLEETDDRPEGGTTG